VNVRGSSIDAVDRAEHPLTYVIDSSLERSFAHIRMRRRTQRDALTLMRELLGDLASARSHALMLACMGKPKRARTVSLERAAQRMLDVDLDSAWRAALRGDDTVLHDRLAPHVSAPPRRPPKGSPWRSSGWLTRRAR
jgi:hypothetical protein